MLANYIGFLDDRRHTSNTLHKEIQMSFADIQEWLIQAFAPTGAIGIILYFTLKKFIENKLDKELEENRSEKRRKEEEIKQLREFMSSLKRERGTRIDIKKIEAAESIIRSRDELSKLHMFVRLIGEIDIKKAIKSKEREEIGNMFSELSRSMSVDRIAETVRSLDESISFLYLDAKTIDIYDAYRFIIWEAVLIAKALENPTLFDEEALEERKASIELIMNIYPESKSEFEKYGHQHSHKYLDRLYQDILKSLRQELLGEQSNTRDYETTASLMQQTRAIQEEKIPINLQKEIIEIQQQINRR